MNKFIQKLHEEVWFQDFIKNELEPEIPIVPSFNPSEDNTDDWKQKSGLREGYLLALTKMGINHD